MNLKKPLKYEEQLQQLVGHGLVVDENKKEEYIDILSKVNYYRFTGYALQFRISENDSNFIKGTTFENIYDIYLFDQELRNTLRKYIEITEVYYRAQISYIFALVKCNKEPFDQHYDENNYYNKEGAHEVLDSFEKERNYYKDSLIVKHHKDKYSSKMPLWVMVELMSFSNISKLYSSMYFGEKDKIAQAVGTGRNTLENNLHCLSVLRNKCAHAARLYNNDFNPPANLSVNLLRKNPDIRNNTLFAYIYVLIRRLPNDDNRKEAYNSICSLIEKYSEKIDLGLIGFPNNYSELLKKSF